MYIFAMRLDIHIHPYTPRTRQTRTHTHVYLRTYAHLYMHTYIDAYFFVVLHTSVKAAELPVSARFEYHVTSDTVMTPYNDGN